MLIAGFDSTPVPVVDYLFISVFKVIIFVADDQEWIRIRSLAS